MACFEIIFFLLEWIHPGKCVTGIPVFECYEVTGIQRRVSATDKYKI